MVATLLRLRFRVLGNQLTSSVWQLIGFTLGMLWALAILGMAWAGVIAAGFAGLSVITPVAIAGGAALLFGWTLGPVLVAGLDTTLDPDKLAPFPISTDRMMVALSAAGLTGIPGIATALGALALIAGFIHWPLAALTALVCVPLGVLTCVIASRLITSLMSGAAGNRRLREIFGGIAFLLVVLIGPIIAGLSGLVGSAASGGDQLARIQAVIDAVAWTPLGAAWAVPAAVAAGDPLGALVKLAVAVATPVLLWWLWRRILVASQGAPVRAQHRRVKSGALGWFGRVPTGGTGASWARAQSSWLHDPRYLRQLLTVPIFPVLMFVAGGADLQSPQFIASPVLIALVLAVVPYVDVSYDGTAFAAVLAAGVRGRADRTGRMLAATLVTVPLLIVVSIITTWLSGTWELLPGVLGAGIGLVLTGFGVSAVSSALMVVPVAAAGDSPFKRVPGTTALMGLVMFAIWLGILVLGSPAVILAVIGAIVGSQALIWASLATGIVLGTLLLALGVVIGGRIFDRTAPRLLLQLRAMQHA